MPRTQHTPGPWHVGEADGSLWVSGHDTNANVLCEIVGRDEGLRPGTTDLTPEDCANARLIAAAPELLAACEQLLSRGIADASTMKRAAAAVARATPPPDGRPDP
jgi:hypothetical protein